MEPLGYGKKKLMLIWKCHLLLSWFPANCHLLLLSHLSANDKYDIELNPGLLDRTLGIYLAE